MANLIVLMHKEVNGVEYLVKAKGIFNSIEKALGEADGLWISGEVIADVGSYKKMHEERTGLKTLDLSDYYLFPGLINTHVHLEFDTSAQARENFIEGTPGTRFLMAVKNARALLLSGVTTIRDAGSSWQTLDLHHKQVQQMEDLPRVQLAGPPLTVTGGHLCFLGEETDDIADMIRQVRRRHKLGCDAIKLIVTGGQMTPGSMPESVSLKQDEIKAVVDEAHMLGMKTFAHCLTTEGFVRCMRGGVDCIEHIACFMRSEKNNLLERVYEEETMEKFRGCRRDFMMGLSAGYHNLDGYRTGKIACSRNQVFLLEQEEKMFEIFKKCVRLGLTPVCGTDAGTGGTFFDETWKELVLMVERGGMSCAGAILTGTTNAAVCLGLEKTTGRIEKNYAADLIGMKKNPLEEIRALGDVEKVICRGKVVK